MRIYIRDPLTKTKAKTTMYVDLDDYIIKKYGDYGLMSCKKCPLDTEENFDLCPGGPVNKCINAVAKFLKCPDILYGDDGTMLTSEPDPFNPKKYVIYDEDISPSKITYQYLNKLAQGLTEGLMKGRIKNDC